MSLFVRILAPAAAGALLLQSPLRAATLTEDFSTDPQSRGWTVFGDASLFAWQAGAGALGVTWDSSRSNSYYYHRLDTVLSKADDFSLAFDLRLDSVVDGSFQIAVGFINLAGAEATNFFRGTGFDSPNLAEFSYFQAYRSIDAVSADGNSKMQFAYDDQLPLALGTTYHIILAHAAGSTTVSGQVFTNGVLYTALPKSYPDPTAGDFRLNAVGVLSYSGENSYGAAVLATGLVDNLVVTTPAPPLATINGGLPASPGQVQFASQLGWTYSLDRTTDLRTWTPAVGVAAGTGGTLTLRDPSPPAGKAFYRVSAERP